ADDTAPAAWERPGDRRLRKTTKAPARSKPMAVFAGTPRLDQPTAADASVTSLRLRQLRSSLHRCRADAEAPTASRARCPREDPSNHPSTLRSCRAHRTKANRAGPDETRSRSLP